MSPNSPVSSAPVSASHTSTVLSSLAVTTNRPSGLKAALLMSPACPRSSATPSHVPASQTRAMSLLTVTRRLPSGLKAGWYPARSFTSSPVMMFDTFVMYKYDSPNLRSGVQMTNLPSGLSATLSTLSSFPNSEILSSSVSQTCAPGVFPSPSAVVAICFPSRLRVRVLMSPAYSWRARFRPDAAFHTHTLRSLVAATTRRPSSLKARCVTLPVSPCSSATARPSETPDTRATSPSLTVSTDLLSGLNDAECPRKVSPSRRPVAASQTATTLNRGSLTVTINLSSGLNDAALKGIAGFPSSVSKRIPVPESQTRAVPSSLAVTISLPSELSAAPCVVVESSPSLNLIFFADASASQTCAALPIVAVKTMNLPSGLRSAFHFEKAPVLA